jgi:hypothetical protein
MTCEPTTLKLSAYDTDTRRIVRLARVAVELGEPVVAKIAELHDHEGALWVTFRHPLEACERDKIGRTWGMVREKRVPIEFIDGCPLKAPSVFHRPNGG